MPIYIHIYIYTYISIYIYIYIYIHTLHAHICEAGLPAKACARCPGTGHNTTGCFDSRKSGPGLLIDRVFDSLHRQLCCCYVPGPGQVFVCICLLYACSTVHEIYNLSCNIHRGEVGLCLCAFHSLEKCLSLLFSSSPNPKP